MTWNRNSLPAAGRTLLGLAMVLAPWVMAGCRPGLTVIDADAPVVLAEPVVARVYADVGPRATPGHPHVERWELQAARARLAAGKYVITRRPPAAATTAPAR